MNDPYLTYEIYKIANVSNRKFNLDGRSGKNGPERTSSMTHIIDRVTRQIDSDQRLASPASSAALI